MPRLCSLKDLKTLSENLVECGRNGHGIMLGQQKAFCFIYMSIANPFALNLTESYMFRNG